LLDRIDIHIHVPRLEYGEIAHTIPAESSAIIRKRVEGAHELQRERLKKYGVYCNSQMNHKQVKHYCLLTDEAQSILKDAFTRMNLSARSYDRIIKVARTIADLSQNEKIRGQDIAEAIHFRSDIQELL
jgi:magnesium chelatase family protein